MGTSSNDLKDSLLGMPHGTAANKLRKMILFCLVQETGKDVCFKCGRQIETVDELSIEHKEPWQKAEDPLKAFFDLNNISFSHMTCNLPEPNLGGTNRRKIGPPGTAWCGGHQAFLPVEQFSKNKGLWNGLSDRCKECQRSSQASWRARKG